MKIKIISIWIYCFFIIFSNNIYAQRGNSKKLSDYIKKPVVDEFNDLVNDSNRENHTPKRGGQIVVRIPVDPKNFNPITDNSAQTQIILSYLFDSLITRDPLTLEWLPWIAKRWEERDTITLSNGKTVEGRILSLDNDSVIFAENEGKTVFGKHDIERYDIHTGKVILKDGKEFSGKINELKYTIELEPQLNEKFKKIPINEVSFRNDIKDKKAVFKNVVYYFTIRNGVKWHDGAPFTVEDIKFSLDTIRNQYVDAAPLRNYYNDIKELDIIDNETVKFVYSKSYFLSLNFCGGLSIFPKHIYNPDKFGGDQEAFGKSFNDNKANMFPIGSGAYHFLSWEKGKNIVLERVRDYWASSAGLPYWKKDQPYLDKIIWTVINNKTAALKELQNGNVDADLEIEPDIWFLDQVNSDDFKSKFVRAKTILPMYSYVGWNMDSPYFSDKKVRQAMSRLIPIDKIGKDIHQGLVVPVNGPFYINGPIYDHSLKLYDYSIKDAKKLLRQAGWLDHDGDGVIDKDGKKFEFEYLIHNGRDYHQKIADIVKESVEKAGIKMLIRKIDWTIFAETVADRKFDAVRFAWGSGIDDDPFQIWHSSQIGNRSSNYVGFRNKRADQILEEGRERFDPVKRWELYKELGRILYDEQPYTFMFCFETLMFYNKKYRNVKLYSTQPGYDFREWYIYNQAEGK